VDGRGYITNYTYNDPTSKVTTISYTGPVKQTANYTYDSYGRIATVTDWNGAYSYSYDDNNATILDTTHYTGISPQQISYDYYPNGSKSAITSSEGAASYVYDADGRLVQLTNPYNEQFNWTYLNNSWEWTQSLPCGVKTVYTYDARGDIIDQSSLSGNTKLTDYSGMYYDAHGNRQVENVNIAGSAALSGVTNYQYDSRNELQTESTTRFGGLSNSFVYDAAGNATTFKGRSLSYNMDNQIIGNTYDSNGNPTTYSGVNIAYDQVNRPTSFGSVLTAGYREDNLRAWKQNSSGKTYFIYDDERHPVLELNAAGTVTAYNTYCVEGLLSRRSSGVSHFYTFDPLGSLLQVFNSSGTILTDCTYDSTGVNEGGTTTDPFGFDARWGLYYDNETGLYLATYRYYDPVNGRFINRDPIHFAGGLNLYAYTFNNYTSADDSTGLSTLFCWRPISLGITTPPWPTTGHNYIIVKCPGGKRWCIGFGMSDNYTEPDTGKTACRTNTGGYKSRCEVMPTTPAQDRCLCDNNSSAQNGNTMCGQNWYNPGPATSKSKCNYGFIFQNCQCYIICLLAKCNLYSPELNFFPCILTGPGFTTIDDPGVFPDPGLSS
jgi:RHS repeat-associated protein